MKVEIRLFATFRDGRGKKAYIDMENPTPEKLLKQIGIEKEDIAILLVNGMDGKYDQLLNDGDYLSVFPPVGGG